MSSEALRCAGISRFVDTYLDGEFGEGDRVEFESHLSDCDSCRAKVRLQADWKKAVQAKGLGASRTLPPAPERPWGVLLHEMMSLLGPPDVDLNDSVALLEELDALDAIATPERQKLWVRFPIEAQKRWLSHLVARRGRRPDADSSRSR